jgi:hypothetical protein
MRVLVCGGRDFDDAGLMISILDRLHTVGSTRADEMIE